MKISVPITCFIILLLFSQCSKDILRSYEDRIVGTWRISDVDRFGLGGGSRELPFRDGVFTFYNNGSLDYIDGAGASFRGTWNIEKRRIDDNQWRSLRITVVDFNTQRMLSEFYDDMNFAGTNHFKATIHGSTYDYITHFRR